MKRSNDKGKTMTRAQILWDDDADGNEGWFMRYWTVEDTVCDESMHMPTDPDATDDELISAAKRAAEWTGEVWPGRSEIEIIRPAFM